MTGSQYPKRESSKGRPILGVCGGIVAALVAPMLSHLMFFQLGVNWLIPMFVIGLMVGASVRLLGRSRERWVAVVAGILTGVSCLASAWWLDSLLFDPFELTQTLGRIFGLLPVIVYVVSVQSACVLALRTQR